MNYLAVNLKAGESWTYLPSAGHTVAWAALSRGSVSVGELADAPMTAGELVVFDQPAGFSEGRGDDPANRCGAGDAAAPAALESIKLLHF